MSPDEQLARWVAGLRIEALATDIVASGRVLLLDAIASAIAGRTTREARDADRFTRRQFGPGESLVIGGAPMSRAGAAFLNGFQTTAATVCDVHRATLTHVTPEVVPAVLAVAIPDDGTEPPTGADLLAGIIAGCEVAVRVAEALDGEEHTRRGWHNPGIAGAVGAAAAVARTLQLDATGVRHAFGHAASQAAGTFAALGTPGVKMHQARGALSGLLAGTLAAAGVHAALDALTAPHGGLLPAYAGGGTPERLVDDLGTRWILQDIALRRWPAASSLQSVIAATLDAVGALPGGIVLGDIREVRVDLPPRAHGLNAGHGWGTQLEALQSARWVVAVTLADGGCWVEQTAPARLTDPDVGGFAATRVLVERDDDLPLAAARVTLTMHDGRRSEQRVDMPPGDPARRLTEDELGRKLRRAARGSGLDAARVLDALADLPHAPSAAALVTALTPHPGGPPDPWNA